MLVDILTSPLAFLIITLGLILSLVTWANERITEDQNSERIENYFKALNDRK